MLASLGFPIVFLTLLLHGGAVFLLRQGLLIPGTGGEIAWDVLLAIGLMTGFGLSCVRDRKVS